jgi:hypothetical protein
MNLNYKYGWNQAYATIVGTLGIMIIIVSIFLIVEFFFEEMSLLMYIFAEGTAFILLGTGLFVTILAEAIWREEK